MNRLLLVIAFAAASTIGCGGAVFYATTPPPTVRGEAFGVAPGPGFVWVNGYWGWRGGNYVWVPGRWARPPRRNAVWVAPYWEPHGGRYRFHQGRWR